METIFCFDFVVGFFFFSWFKSEGRILFWLIVGKVFENNWKELCPSPKNIFC